MYQAIAKYLSKNIDKLYTYKWKLNDSYKKFGIELEGSNVYEKTKDLKAKLRQHAIKHQNNRAELEEVAKYFITDWGGVRNLKKHRNIVDEFKTIEFSKSIPENFDRKLFAIRGDSTGPRTYSASSWSKWISLVCPDWACIYDARVAYSLNTINYIEGHTAGLGTCKIYPSPQGQNRNLSFLDIETLIKARAITNSEIDEKNQNNLFHDNNNAYFTYLKVLEEVSSELWKDRNRIQDVEMLLFILADSKIFQDLKEYIRTSNRL